MAIAHIIIELEDNHDAGNYALRLTYSGGNDLEIESSRQAFDALLETISTVLSD